MATSHFSFDLTIAAFEVYNPCLKLLEIAESDAKVYSQDEWTLS